MAKFGLSIQQLAKCDITCNWKSDWTKAMVLVTIFSIGIVLLLGLILTKWNSMLGTSTADRFIKQLPMVGSNEVNPKQTWFQNGRALVHKGLQEITGPFVIPTSTGPKIVVRQEYTEEFTRSQHISGVETLRVDAFADYPGFEAGRVAIESLLLRNTLSRRLTKSLEGIRCDMTDEVAHASVEIFGDCRDWKITSLQADVSALSARLVSRTMVGKPLCYNQEWNKVTAEYTRLAFVAASELRRVHALLRPVQHWFLQPCVELRRTAKEARRLIATELRRRELACGEDSSPSRSDGLHWLLEEIHASRSSADVAAAELHLSLIGVQTTSHSLGQALRILCENPQWSHILRNEIHAAVAQYGWTKHGLNAMPNLDAFLKEAQRITTGYLAMNSVVTQDVSFKDGFTLPKGTRCVLESRFLDPGTYPSPHEFDPNRFLRVGQERSEDAPDTSSFVATSVEHLGFGYALRSCPGRFLAADMMKIAFGYLVLHYDWDFVPSNSDPILMEVESIQILRPDAKLRMKRVH